LWIGTELWAINSGRRGQAIRLDKEDVRGILKGAGIVLVAILLIHYFPLHTPESDYINRQTGDFAFRRSFETFRGIAFYMVVIGGLLYLAFGD